MHNNKQIPVLSIVDKKTHNITIGYLKKNHLDKSSNFFSSKFRIRIFVNLVKILD